MMPRDYAAVQRLRMLVHHFISAVETPFTEVTEIRGSAGVEQDVVLRCACCAEYVTNRTSDT